MKAIFMTAGSDGDVHPHLALAGALRERRHEVVFLNTFEYIEAARALGLRAVCILDGEEKHAFLEEPGRMRPVARIRGYFRFLSGKIAACARLAADEIDADSVIVAPLALAGVARLLHDRYATPYVSTMLTPADLISLRDPPFYKSLRGVLGLPYWLRRPAFGALEHALIDPLCRGLLREAARAFDRPLPRRMYSRWLFSPQRILGLFPEWFCRCPPDWPGHVELSGFPLYQAPDMARELPENLLRFLDAGPPPVVVATSTAATKGRAFFETAVAALQAAGQRGILLSRFADQMPALPEGIVHESYLPLDLLLPRVGAFVHQGGIGTAALAMAAGTPQLLLPSFSNQPDNARRVAALGCGITLERGHDAATIASALRELTGPESIERCRAVQRRIEPGERARARAADVIERTARHVRDMPALAA